MIESYEGQQEIAEFVESMKVSGSVLHHNPRFIHHEANFNMEFFNQKNYIDLFFSLTDLVPGNEYNWRENPTCKITMEFDNGWVNTVVHLPYEESKFTLLQTFADQNRLRIIDPTKKEPSETDVFGEEEEAKLIFGKEKIKYFMVDGLALFDVDTIKQFIVTMDNLLHDYEYVAE